ncbi:MAG: hypothetical protein KGH71_04180 [Candidatus Micrarchaeota archaeon]|nr:hypothetical protein [Candidatus Micrarchaeota archaeon]
MANRTYIITKDVNDTLLNKLGVNEVMTVPKLRDQIDRLQDSLIKEFKGVLSPDTNIKVFDTATISSSIQKKLVELVRNDIYPISISLDRVYRRYASLHLEVTRAINPINGDKLPLTNRHNSAPLQDQVKDLAVMINFLKHKYPSKKIEVAMLDVGSFEGNTVTMIEELLRSADIFVNHIVLGLSTPQGYGNLLKIYGDRVSVRIPTEFYEWMELRDLFLIDGKQVPDSYRVNGARVFVPYTEMLVKDASVPEQNEREAIEICLRYNKEILEILKSNGVNRDRIGEFVLLTEEAKRNIRNRGN